MKRQRTRWSVAKVDYLKHLENKGRKRATVKNQANLFSAIIRTFGDIYVDEFKAAHMDILFSENKWIESTRNNYLSNLRTFWIWATRSGIVKQYTDPTVGWSSVRVPKPKKVWIDPEDFPRLLDVAGEFHARDRIVVALGLFTFCRGSELRQLRISDVHFDTNSIEVFRIKTSTYDELPMTLELRDELLIWFNRYRELMEVSTLEKGWLVVPSYMPGFMRRDPLTNRLAMVDSKTIRVNPTAPVGHMWLPVKRAMQNLGLDTHRAGVHSLRRSGAKAAFAQLRNDGYDRALGRVSAMLGHQSVKTTEIYTGISLDRVERDETWAGKPMFPNLFKKTNKLEVISDGDSAAQAM